MIFIVLLIPTVFLLFTILINVFNDKFSLLEISVGALATTALVASSIMLLGDVLAPYVTSDMIANIAFVTCLLVFVHKKTKNILLSGHFVFLTMIIGMVGDTLTSTLVTAVFTMTVENVRDNLIMYFVLILPSFLFCYSLSRIIGKRLNEGYTRLSLDARKKFALHGFVLSAITYLLTHLNILAYRNLDDITVLSSVNVIIIGSIFLIALISSDSYSKAQQLYTEAEFERKAQSDLDDRAMHLEKFYEEIRSYYHDNQNLLCSLIGFSDSNNSAGLKNHLAENLSFIEEVLSKMDDSMDRLRYIHLPELKGLLSVKFAHALTQGIELELDLAEPIDDIPINRMSLSRIMGIMVDNAIEELISSENPKKLLKFGIIKDGTDTLIICANSCKTPPKPENLFIKGFSTKGNGRGMGLYNLKKICDESGNAHVFANMEEGEFDLIVTVRQV